MIALPKLAGVFSRSRRFCATWKSMMRGEDEGPISFGDKSIMFIRLTSRTRMIVLIRKYLVTSTSAKQQRTLNLGVCRGIGATLIAANGSGEQAPSRLSAIDQ